MKSKIALLIMLAGGFLLTAFSQTAFGQMNEKKIGLGTYSRLIVKSNLKVVLVESDKIDTARIEGSKKFLETVMIIQAGEELIVRAKSFRDLKKEGTVYIPVRRLQHLEVNADAKVISFTILKSPELNLLINGNCVVSLVLNGKLNIHDAEGYDSKFRRVYHQSNTPIYLNNFFNN